MGAPKGNKNAKGHGAPKGNKNAVGFGAPYGNRNAVKNGLFVSPWVYIPPTPENTVIFDAMQADGAKCDYRTFNEYKKNMHKEFRAALDSNIVECNGKRYKVIRRYNWHAKRINVYYILLEGSDGSSESTEGV